jgi:hypothetical protein
MFGIGDVIIRIGRFDKFIIFGTDGEFYTTDKIMYDGSRSRTYYVPIKEAMDEYVKIGTYGRRYSDETPINEFNFHEKRR